MMLFLYQQVVDTSLEIKELTFFVEAINKLRFDSNLKKEVIAFIEVPAWVHSARKDLADRLAKPTTYTTPIRATLYHTLVESNE